MKNLNKRSPWIVTVTATTCGFSATDRKGETVVRLFKGQAGARLFDADVVLFCAMACNTNHTDALG